MNSINTGEACTQSCCLDSLGVAWEGPVGQGGRVAPGGSLEAESSAERGGQTRLGHLIGDTGYLEVEERAWREESCGLTLL